MLGPFSIVGPAQSCRKMRAKLTCNFADIQVGYRLRPDVFGAVALVVLRRPFAGVTGDLLPILSGFVVQV